MNPWPTIYRAACIAAVILLCIVGALLFAPKIRMLAEFQRRKSQMAEENQHTAALTRELREKEARFNTDPAFVERVAKDAGMIRPDEVVFKFTNEAWTAGSRR